LQSYAFTDSLVRDNHLAPKITKKRSALMLWLRGPRHLTRWKLYKVMSHHFDCDFSIRTGNLTMTFIDKDPDLARFILRQYIDRLRSQLRREDVQASKVAIKSLQEQAKSSSDPMLSAQLYLTISQQMQQEGTAEMSADYAFEVIEPAVVPDEVYSPWALIDTLAALVVSALTLLIYLYAKDRYRRFKRDVILASDELARSSPNGASESSHQTPNRATSERALA
jgi:hypothetical protein